MIAVDSSALVAIIFGEPELERFSAIIAREPAIMAAPSVTETAMVVEGRQGIGALHDLHLTMQRGAIEVVPVDAESAWAAHSAWQRFGKGRHRAGLNFGDCFSYALAKTLSVPLLFKGDDFTLTDITAAT